MEISGVTCLVDTASAAVKDNSKLLNDCAIDMLMFLFSIGPGTEGTGPKSFLRGKLWV